MHWILLAVLATLAGFLFPIVQAKVGGFIPGSITGNPIGSALVTGGFILVTLMVASFGMKLVFGKRHRLAV
jgi:hypothetical protein